MDQGLKERLIGAAVLVALGVWLIPWVLNGPDEQTIAKSSALQLPATEEPLPIRSQTLSLDDNAAPEAAAAPLPVASAARAVDTEPDVGPAIASAAPSPAATAAPTAPVHEDSAAAGAVPPTVKAAPVPATKPAAASAKTAAPPAARATAAAPTDAKGSWVVQLGSFGEEANARRLADRVRTFGYKPDVSSVRSGGRSMYRVRVGPAVSHNEADATASALGAHGLTARVVAAE